MIVRNARQRFTVNYTEEDIGYNISLVAKMKNDFGIKIPTFEHDEMNMNEDFSLVKEAIIDGFNESPSRINENDHIDQYINLEDSNLIKDVDSSQIMAILDINQGSNMVIQGPPRTGKSQTITNLIAEAIGHGKKSRIAYS